jgi:hypothetical protein
MNSKLLIIISIIVVFIPSMVSGQWSETQGCVIDINGDCTPNPVTTALPFLSIIPDARGGAMGDAGIATSPDASSIYYNPSKLAFVQKDAELTATYTPWLRNLGLTDVYVAYLSGYKKIDDLQAVGFNIGYFSLGQINFTDINGNGTGTGMPREFSAAVSYARKLSPNFAAGIGGKFFYSNLASGQAVNGQPISAASGFAADISMTYNSNPDLTGPGSNFTGALALSNMGSKISYTNQQIKEFIPTNLGLGFGYKINMDDYNSITFALDFNKLLVPTSIPAVEPFLTNNTGNRTNGTYDSNDNGTADYREGSTFSNILSSFGDAPGGFSEELKEISTSFGIEYWYDNQFAVRAGYFNENRLKGDRQFLTVGIGLKYNVFGFDISYLAPTNTQRNPLDNTLRFSFTFDLGIVGGSGQQ